MPHKRITIFAAPKPFVLPHVIRIQTNAIASWAALPDAEVFLMGTDEGIAEIAERFGCVHIPDIAVNEYGTPMLDSAFALAHARSKAPYTMYINGDIILPDTFMDILPRLPARPLLAVSRRTDIDLLPEEHALDAEARATLFKRARRDGVLHSVQGIDFFLCRTSIYPPIPPFAIGRIAFDSWMLRSAHVNHMMLIDVTEVVTIIHQNHPLEAPNALARQKKGPEALRNMSYMKRKTWYYTIADAPWRLTPAGLRFNWVYWEPYLRRFVRALIRP